MIRLHFGGLGPAFAWFVFPIVPVLLGRAYYETMNSPPSQPIDPYRWDWVVWFLMAGPLVGYGFLAGATLGLADDPARRGPRSWPARRMLWVGVGPWLGYLVLMGLSFVSQWVVEFADRTWPTNPPRSWMIPDPSLRLALVIGALVMAPYGWLPVAWAALRRARRAGQLRQAIERGLFAAFAFVGSLFGSFWAITAAWRSYFFDPRVVPLVMATLGLAMTGGCASPMTYGEMRRGELFRAMLIAWLVGLALAWRWWSRPRHKT